MFTRNLIFQGTFVLFLANSLSNHSFAEPFHHKFGELREYHQHWLAVCPNKSDAAANSDYQRTCWATTHAGNTGALFDERLSVSRDRFSGEFKIRFVTSAYQKLDRSKPVVVKFSNGKYQLFQFGSSVQSHESINEFLLAADDPISLVQAMKKANWMTLSIPTSDGPVRETYSMIGLTSALGFTEKYAGWSK